MKVDANKVQMFQKRNRAQQYAIAWGNGKIDNREASKENRNDDDAALVISTFLLMKRTLTTQSTNFNVLLTEYR